MRITKSIFAGFVLVVSIQLASAQRSTAEQAGDAVDGLQMAISQHGMTKTGLPNLQVTFLNVSDRDLTVLLGIIGGYSPRPCNLDGREVSCDLNFKLKVTDSSRKTRAYEFSGMVYVAGRLDPYIVSLRPHSTYTLELGLDQFWSPTTKPFEVALPSGTCQLSLEFEGRAMTHINPNQPETKLTFW